MTNDEISEVFRNIGNLLQIKGDDSFRARIMIARRKQLMNSRWIYMA